MAIETTGVYGKFTAPFLSGLTKKLVDVSPSGDPRERQLLHQHLCPLLWSGETLPAYWSVCKFDLILPVLFLVVFNLLTTTIAYHLPLYQCVVLQPLRWRCVDCVIHHE